MGPRVTIAATSLMLLGIALSCGGSEAQRPTSRPASRPSTWKTVSPNEFQKLVKDSGNIILDIRTPREFQIGHIRGSVNIDFKGRDFEKKISELDKSTTYLVYCRTGMRSAQAAKKLNASGFTSIYELDGGIAAWWEAGKPVD